MALLASAPLAANLAGAQSPPTTAPANASPFTMQTWISALNAPGPVSRALGSVGPVVPQTELDLNINGLLGTYQPNGATVTSTNAFFQSLGTNGRTCATCHQPASAMSISGPAILGRWLLSNGNDPLFAPVDGANCPSAVPAAYTSKSYLGGRMGSGKNMAAAHSVLLTRGAFRIFLPVPANAEFTLRVVNDPNGCNTDPTYATVTDPTTNTTSQMVSVYRRPLLATNLKFVLESNSFGGPGGGGGTLVTDPGTGGLINGNIMWDGREATLESQALDATLGHAQAASAPSQDQIAQMVSFEMGIFSAQQSNWFAGNLATNGAIGGPLNLSTNVGIAPGGGGPPAGGGGPPAGGGGFTPPAAFDVFASYSTVTGTSLSALQQASIYRGQQIFNTVSFDLSNVPTFRQGQQGTCSLCHGMHDVGSDQIPNAQHAVGVGGDAQAVGGPAAASDLPIFELTCPATTPNGYGTTVLRTNDPGKALISGKCADIGAFTTPPLRGLSSHAPYFHDGSAANLRAVVDFYAKRLAIPYSEQDKVDLVNFLSAL